MIKHLGYVRKKFNNALDGYFCKKKNYHVMVKELYVI